MYKQIAVAAIYVLFCWGCQVYHSPEPPRTGHYYINPRANFATVGRVVLLELDNLSSRQELSGIVTQTLADGVNKRHVFSVQTAMRSDPIWQTLRLDNIKAQAFEDLAAVRQTLGIDGIMFGTIQRYQPFPHLQMSINLKLIDARSGQLLWAFEDVWDSSDKVVENRMRTFFDQQMRSGYEPMDWQIMLASPRAFERFVVYEIAQTLPKQH
jgi:TolB-like protein